MIAFSPLKDCGAVAHPCFSIYPPNYLEVTDTLHQHHKLSCSTCLYLLRRHAAAFLRPESPTSAIAVIYSENH